MSIKDFFVTPEQGRLIAYPQEDYTRTLARLFNGALTKEDLIDALGAVWKPIGSGDIETTDEEFILKNFSNEFVQYYLLITGLLVDNSSQGSGAFFRLQMSSDNGSTWDSGSTDYSWSEMIQYTAGINVDTGGSNSYAELLDGTSGGANGTTIGDAAGEEGTFMIYINSIGDSKAQSSYFWKFSKSSSTGGIVYGWGNGHRNALGSHNALRLFTDSTTPTVFSSGSYSLYGIRRAT